MAKLSKNQVELLQEIVMMLKTICHRLKDVQQNEMIPVTDLDAKMVAVEGEK